MLAALEKYNTRKSKEDIQPALVIDDHEEIHEIDDENEQHSMNKNSNESLVVEHVNDNKKTTASNESPSQSKSF